MPKHLINRERKTTISTRRSAPSKTLPNTQQSDKTSGFLDLILQRLSWQELDQFNQRKHKAGRPAHRLSRGQLLVGLLFHFSVGWAGTFSEHLLWLLGVKMTDSSLSQRRQALPFEVFVDLLRRMLRPIANAPEAARYRQWLLVAIDGTSFSLANTPQVKEKCRKGRNQRGQAAFAKMLRGAGRSGNAQSSGGMCRAGKRVRMETGPRITGLSARPVFIAGRPALRLRRFRGTSGAQTQ